MHELIGKEVEVNTVGVVYRGVLVEIEENEIHLQSQYGWISIPFERVADVRAVD